MMDRDDRRVLGTVAIIAVACLLGGVTLGLALGLLIRILTTVGGV